MDYSQIRGFNYQPSYGSSGFEIWQYFSAETVERELSIGKTYFPHINAIRLWLSWDSFSRNPRLFARDFETALDIAARLKLSVMPVLFNRWHDAQLDYGGIYVDHFLPRVSWVQRNDMFTAYLDEVVGEHSSDDRIFAWDLCNEPFSYSCSADDIPEIAKAEHDWLAGLYAKCKQLKSEAPITIGTHQCEGVRGLERVESICDFMSIHPYWQGGSSSKKDFEKGLDDYAAFAARVKKPLLASETCWGSLDDKERVEIIRYTLGELKKRHIGWLAYLLNHSAIADAHREEYGPVDVPGNLSFIEADERIRPGHECFNDF